MTSSFPVPTAQHRDARYVERGEAREVQPGTGEAIRARLAEVRARLANGRVANRNAVVDEQALRLTDEETKGKMRRNEQVQRRHEARILRLKQLGLTEETAYLATPLAALSSHSSVVGGAAGGFGSYSNFAGNKPTSTSTTSSSWDANQYEKNIRRVLGRSGGSEEEKNKTTPGIPPPGRLRRDLIEKEQNLKAKRRKMEQRNSHRAEEDDSRKAISQANAEFNRKFSQSLKQDAKTQLLKQNLERGTAL